MNIEQAIIDLTAAVNANTEALNKVLAQAGTAPAPEPAKKTRAKKAEVEPEQEQPAAEPTPEPEIVTDQEPVGEDKPETTTTMFADQDDFIAKLTSKVQGIFAAAGNSVGEKKEAYAALRQQFGVKTAKELDESKWNEFWEAVGNM